MADIYFWRQIFLLAAIAIFSVSVGFVHAYPSVLNLTITSFNSTDIHTSKDHATWIAAVNGVGGLLGALGLSPILDIYGRKAVQYTMGFCLFIGWLIIPFAKDIGALYAMRFIQGISAGNVYIAGIIIGEYVHPRRRGYFITLKKLAMTVGTLLCHAMSAFWTWRQIGIFAAIPALMFVIMVFFCTESPYYLASNGKFEECERSFRWIMGDSVEIQKELKAVIDTQQKRDDSKRSNKSDYNLTNLVKIFSSKKFQKEFVITTLLSLAVELAGRFFIVSYSVQIMMVLVNSKTSALYFTLGVDLFIIIAALCSTFITKYFARRAIFFSTGIFSVLLMLLISVMVYANTIYNFSKYVMWFIAVILIFQCFVVNLGLIPMSFTFVSEIITLEHKGLGLCITSIVFTILHAIFLKVTPIMIDGVGLHGTYGIFGLFLAICLVFLFKTLPETKDKTLQQITAELHGELSRKIVESEALMH